MAGRYQAAVAPQDAQAPILAEAEAQGLLPAYGGCVAFRGTLHND
jgi:dTDP-4-dehydrorhamnose 3,5-epimerase